MNPVFIPWMAEIGVITYRALNGVRFTLSWQNGQPTVNQTTGPKRFPLPSEILSTFIVFGAYSVIAEGQGEMPRIGALLGWGTVIATVLMMAQHGTPASSAQSAPGTELRRNQAPNFMGPLPS